MRPRPYRGCPAAGSPAGALPLAADHSREQQLDPLATVRSGLDRVYRRSRLHRATRDGHPHVTVAHELPDNVLARAQDVLAGYEARFPVTGFALYMHGDDGVWRVRRMFPYGR